MCDFGTGLECTYAVSMFMETTGRQIGALINPSRTTPRGVLGLRLNPPLRVLIAVIVNP